MGRLGVHARVRGRADHRRQPGRPARAQAPVPARHRRLRRRQPRGGRGPDHQRADRRARRPGRRGGDDVAAGARHVPGDVRRQGARRRLRRLRGDAGIRLGGRPHPRRRAHAGEPVRLGMAHRVPRERPDRHRIADRRGDRRPRDAGALPPAARPGRRRRPDRRARGRRLPDPRGPAAGMAGVGVGDDRRRASSPSSPWRSPRRATRGRGWHRSCGRSCCGGRRSPPG